MVLVRRCAGTRVVRALPPDLLSAGPLAAAAAVAVETSSSSTWTCPGSTTGSTTSTPAPFLRRIRFPPNAHRLAFEVLSRSFFADPAELSAAEPALMFHVYFLGSSEGLLCDVPRKSFDAAVRHPLHARPRGLGATVHTGTAVTAVASGRHRAFTVVTEGGATAGEHAADAVVLAADTRGLQRVVAASPDLGGRSGADGSRACAARAPFLVSRLWLGRPLHADRPVFLGTGGFGPLDNNSVLGRYEEEARTWARRTGGCVVELHAHALPDDADPDRVRTRVAQGTRRVCPEAADAEVVDERHELHADCPLFPVGGFGDRPTATTPDPRLVLAGGLVRVDPPVALMERAATSGFQAANALLRAMKVLSAPERDGGYGRAVRGVVRARTPRRVAGPPGGLRSVEEHRRDTSPAVPVRAAPACGADGHGTRAVHSGEANFVRASSWARASSSSVTLPSASPYRARKESVIRSMTASRGRPVCRRSGSTRFFALFVPLSDSFSRPMRSTSTILSASMS
ncbi:hypothetical protein FHS37_006250 [Streptomyces griseostramineus]|uniref:Uncharacterized protein n=1 Tax=Streptomyces griseomycini TaxID=66895 RepID=A0A7W7V9L6_9ACTN|nr:hypothetical protein [Streptomyces griseomycini]